MEIRSSQETTTTTCCPLTIKAKNTKKEQRKGTGQQDGEVKELLSHK